MSVITIRPASLPTLFDYQTAIVAMLDAKAQERRYDGAVSISTYVGSTNRSGPPRPWPLSRGAMLYGPTPTPRWKRSNLGSGPNSRQLRSSFPNCLRWPGRLRGRSFALIVAQCLGAAHCIFVWLLRAPLGQFR